MMGTSAPRPRAGRRRSVWPVIARGERARALAAGDALLGSAASYRMCDPNLNGQAPERATLSRKVAPCSW